MTHPPLRAVLFDLGNTLWFEAVPRPAADCYALIADAVRPMLAAWDKLPDDPLADVVAALVAAEDQWLKLEQQRGRFREASVPFLWRGALGVRGIEVDEAQAAALWRCGWIPAREFGMQLYPDSLDVLAAVRGLGLRIGIATNRPCTAAMLRPDLADFGMAPFIHAVVCSGDTGFTKPHRSVCDAAAAALGIDPAACIMVGDGAIDMIAAKAAGMRGVQKLNGRYGADPCPEAAFAIHDLGELLALPPFAAAGAASRPAAESPMPHDDANEDRW